MTAPPPHRPRAARPAGAAPSESAEAAPRVEGRVRVLGWAALVVLVLGAAAICGDFGITWDTGAHLAYGKDIVRYFQSGFTSPVGEGWSNINDKGPLFDALATTLQQVLGVRPFPLWHFLIALFAILAVAATSAMARGIAGVPVAALGAAALILMPQFFGHAFNNPKDIPFAGLFAWSMLLGTRLLQRRTLRWPQILACATAIGLLLSMRIGGAILLLYLLLLAAYAVAQTLPRGRGAALPFVTPLAGVAVRVAVGFALAWVVMIALWPYAHESPVANPVRAMMRTTSFDRAYPVLFDGRIWDSDALPWSYMLKYFLIVTPLSFLPLAALGIWRSVRIIAADWRSTQALGAVAVLAWFALPNLYFAAVVPNIYDGLRHVLFIFPALAVLVGLGADAIRERLKARFGARWGWIAVTVLLLLEAPAMVRLHPYQVTYFNVLAGPRATLHQRYDVDYWLSSMKEAAEWVNLRQAEVGRPVRVVASVNEFSQICFAYYAAPQVEVLPLFSRVKQPALPPDVDYYVTMTRYGFASNFPRAPIVHRITADGALLTVIKGQGLAGDAGE